MGKKRSFSLFQFGREKTSRLRILLVMGEEPRFELCRSGYRGWVHTGCVTRCVCLQVNRAASTQTCAPLCATYCTHTNTAPSEETRLRSACSFSRKSRQHHGKVHVAFRGPKPRGSWPVLCHDILVGRANPSQVHTKCASSDRARDASSVNQLLSHILHIIPRNFRDCQVRIREPETFPDSSTQNSGFTLENQDSRLTNPTVSDANRTSTTHWQTWMLARRGVNRREFTFQVVVFQTWIWDLWPLRS